MKMILKSYPGHKGRPGQVGGSAPRGGGLQPKVGAWVISASNPPEGSGKAPYYSAQIAPFDIGDTHVVDNVKYGISPEKAEARLKNPDKLINMFQSYGDNTIRSQKISAANMVAQKFPKAKKLTIVNIGRDWHKEPWLQFDVDGELYTVSPNFSIKPSKKNDFER